MELLRRDEMEVERSRHERKDDDKREEPELAATLACGPRPLARMLTGRGPAGDTRRKGRARGEFMCARRQISQDASPSQGPRTASRLR
jgi:hypothetical protein